MRKILIVNVKCIILHLHKHGGNEWIWMAIETHIKMQRRFFFSIFSNDDTQILTLDTKTISNHHAKKNTIPFIYFFASWISKKKTAHLLHQFLIAKHGERHSYKQYPVFFLGLYSPFKVVKLCQIDSVQKYNRYSNKKHDFTTKK